MILELPTKKPADPEALPIGAVIDLRREMPDGTRAHLDKGWTVIGYTESGKGKWSGYELEAADGRRTVASKFEAFDQQRESACMQINGVNLFDGEAGDVDHGDAICERDGEWAKWTAWVLSRSAPVRDLCGEFPVYLSLTMNGRCRWVIGYSEDGYVFLSDHCPRCFPLEITRENAIQVPATEVRALLVKRLN